MVSINIGAELFNYVSDANIVSHMLRILEKGLEAADPYGRVSEYVEKAGDLVRIGGYEYRAERIHVIGFGKASVRMLRAVCDKIGGLIHGGVVINPVETGVICNVEVLKGITRFQAVTRLHRQGGSLNTFPRTRVKAI